VSWQAEGVPTIALIVTTVNKGKAVRDRSVENIIREISEIKKTTNPESINFHDDIFMIQPARLKEFAERYRKEIQIPFVCSLRADQVTEETARLLKDAGCKKVFIGVEAGNDRIRREVLHRSMTREKIFRAVELLKKNKIFVFTQNIIGFPRTGIADDFQTLELNIKLKPDFAWVSIFTPYPGTQLGQWCLEDRLIDSFDGIYETYHYKSSLKVPHNAQINILHKLFSLTVDYPKILPQIREMVLYPDRLDFDAMHELFISYRKYKYDCVDNPKAVMPACVREFMKTHFGDLVLVS
jgi:radical SAM superfamily enzyme YgiQ (UPF0313 family)